MLKIIRGTCGVGKTYSVEQKAIERARRGEKSALLFPDHQVARETVARIRAAGITVLYRMSPHLMVVPNTNRAACKYQEAGSLISRAGMGVARELCHGLGDPHNKCPHLATCPAATGHDLGGSNDQPLVFVAPHQLLGEALEWVRHSGGLLVLDEPPPIVKATRINGAALEAARYATRLLHDGERLDMLLDAVELGIAAGETSSARNVVKAGAAKIDRAKFTSFIFGLGGASEADVTDEKIVERARGATRNEGRPQLSAYGLAQMRAGKGLKEMFANGAQTIAALVRSISSLRIQSSVIENELVIVEESEHLQVALNRAGPTVILDATINLLVLQKFCVETLDETVVIDVDVQDGAPIERVFVPSANANRNRWLDHGERLKLANLVGPLRRALEIVSEDPQRKTLGIVTYKPVAQVIEGVWRSGEDPSTFPPAARGVHELLQPWRERGGELRVLHYGAYRGRNDLADVDALVTLGDPWSTKLDAEMTYKVLGIEFESAYRLECASALEQAVGRLRAPRRAKEALAVVVGSILPRSWERPGASVRVERLVRGRPGSAAHGVRGDVLLAWRLATGVSRRELARQLGIGETTLRRVESGDQGEDDAGAGDPTRLVGAPKLLQRPSDLYL